MFKFWLWIKSWWQIPLMFSVPVQIDGRTIMTLVIMEGESREQIHERVMNWLNLSPNKIEVEKFVYIRNILINIKTKKKNQNEIDS
jgi:hypothetical protein